MNALLQQPEYRLIFEKLRSGLPTYLQYHTLYHTLDVCHRTEQLAVQENVKPKDMRLLLVAAAYHDCGYLQQTVNHEAISCAIAKAILPAYGYSEAELDTICRIIIATQLPQNPQTHLEKIICDADLDYLGREDFLECEQNLYAERLHLGLVKNEREWDEQQVDFFKNHHYFTSTAIALRTARKEINLGIIQQNLLNRDCS